MRRVSVRQKARRVALSSARSGRFAIGEGPVSCASAGDEFVARDIASLRRGGRCHPARLKPCPTRSVGFTKDAKKRSLKVSQGQWHDWATGVGPVVRDGKAGSSSLCSSE